MFKQFKPMALKYYDFYIIKKNEFDTEFLLLTSYLIFGIFLSYSFILQIQP